MRDSGFRIRHDIIHLVWCVLWEDGTLPSCAWKACVMFNSMFQETRDQSVTDITMRRQTDADLPCCLLILISSSKSSSGAANGNDYINLLSSPR